MAAASYHQATPDFTAGPQPGNGPYRPSQAEQYQQRPWESSSAAAHKYDTDDYKPHTQAQTQTQIQTRPAPASGRVSSTAVPGYTAEAVINATRPAELVPETSTPFEGASLDSIRLATEMSLQELINVRNQYPLSTTFSAAGAGTAASGNIHKVRAYHDVTVGDLYLLRKEIMAISKAAEARRLRKWVFGVLIASFIPAVRRIFRRAPDDEEANDTEYAFRKSRSLLGRIRDSVTPSSQTGFLASMTLLVGAVLYVFQNEVTIRVAKTMTKRLKKLAAKIEGGIEVLDEDDMKVFRGWRWRILT